MANLTKEEISRIRKMYIGGIGSSEIAKTLGRSSTCILKCLRREGVEIRPKQRKLSPSDIQNICRQYLEGASAAQIAKRYKVSNAIVLRYLEHNGIERRNASECHRIYPINEDFFDTIDAEEKAYFLGFLYADGGNIKSGNFVRVELQEQDEDILHKFAKLIYKENPEEHVRQSIRKRNLGSGIKEYRSKYLNINSKHVCNVLEKHGCMPAKTFKIEFPSWLPLDLQRHFIRGYFDGDGKVFVNHNKGCGSTFSIASTKDMCSSMTEIINSAAHANLSMYFDRIWVTNCAGDKQIERILDWMYQDATIWMNRKYDSYQQIKNRKRAR